MHPLTQPTQHKRRSAWAQPMKKMTRLPRSEVSTFRLGTANAADTISNQVGGRYYPGTSLPEDRRT
eukprot:scaffold12430_cov137-Skeletonema_marinoi.AAC.7